MTKVLRKVIIKRSNIKKCNKDGKHEKWYLYKRQSSFCVTFLKKTFKE